MQEIPLRFMKRKGGIRVNDKQYDLLLNIRTEGIQRGFHDSLHYNRYEPTPYALLEQLFIHYQLSRSDRFVDYGCGKGRLNFYLHHLFGTETVGVEMDPQFYAEALENRTAYEKKFKNAKGKIHFVNSLAQDYSVDKRDNRFYFFNPFSVQIFIQAINGILRSVEKSPRTIDLILFFPQPDYLDFLEYGTSFEWLQEISLPGVERDLSERFLIYRLL